MKIMLLGTGDGSTILNYNTCFVIDNNNNKMLIDAGGGNGIFKSFEKLKIDYTEIHDIFISHKHMDHLLGVTWIIRRLAPLYYKNKLIIKTNIYGCDEVIKVIKILIDNLIPEDFIKTVYNNINFYVLSDGEKINIINLDFLFFDLHCYKTTQYGFKFNYINRVFTFIGDECCSLETKEFVMNSDYLFADAYSFGKIAKVNNPMTEHHHSSVEYISNIANSCNVKNLILSHIHDYNEKTRKEDFIKAAKENFSGEVFVPEDCEVLEI